MTRMEGLERLKKRFAKIPVEMRRQVRPAIDQGADELIAFQKRQVPVDQGDLRDSIRKEDGPHDLSVAVAAGDDKAFYAAMVEFGTTRSSAQPFFFPPYRVLRRRIRSRITRAINKAVKSNV